MYKTKVNRYIARKITEKSELIHIYLHIKLLISSNNKIEFCEGK